MFGIEAEQWFSFFKRGVALLADMSTFQFTAGQPAFEKQKQFPRQLQSGNVTGKIHYTRPILIKKAKAANFKGHCVPEQSGMASQNNWALRPTEKGHSFPKKKGIASHRKRAWRPTGTGHVPAWVRSESALLNGETRLSSPACVLVFLFCCSASLIAFSRRWLADPNCPTRKEETKTKEFGEVESEKRERRLNEKTEGQRSG